MRLYTYVKRYGGYTKSMVYKLNEENRILVNGKTIPLAFKIEDNDIVTIDNIEIKRNDLVYYLYYKPKGILSIISNNPDSYINHINTDIKLSMAGRLDKDSEGLIILTNDGKYINDLMNSLSKIEKEYIVTLEHPINQEFISNIEKPYIIRNKTTTPIKAKIIDEYNVSMILYEGIYHQIRTIVKLNNNKVINLKRIRINNLKIDDLKPNEMKEYKK